MNIALSKCCVKYYQKKTQQLCDMGGNPAQSILLSIRASALMRRKSLFFLAKNNLTFFIDSQSHNNII